MKWIGMVVAIVVLTPGAVWWTADPSSDGSLPVTPTAEGDRQPRTSSVTGVVPTPNSLGAGASDAIVVGLTAPLDPTSFDPAALSVYGRWSGVAEGSVILDSTGQEIRFVPTRPFHAGEAVTVSLRKGVRTASGTTLEAGYTWTFWVEAASGSLDMTLQGERMVREEADDHTQPYGAYAGDFNEDGYSDLAIPNEVSADVRVMLNDGAGSYLDYAVLEIPLGAWPSPNEGADFDGDGHIDFAVGNGGNDIVTVFNGDGRGAFQVTGNYRAGSQVRGVCIMDLNRDGWPDVATANLRDGDDPSQVGTISLLMNDRTGHLGQATTIQSPGRGEKTCATGDADGDGIMDLFVGAFFSDEVLLFRGDGEGGLQFANRVPAGGSPWMIVTGDMDGDGHVDVLSANRGKSTVAILFGDGAGGLSAPVAYPVGAQPLAVDVGDLDGDGDLDVVTSEFLGKRFTIHENAGDGTLINPRTLDAVGAGSCAIIHDRDRDGDLDITGVDEIADRIFLFVNPGG
jgi:FG-GAP-like repeat/Bacterial Ig-like domain